ncbi:MAG: SPFH domain-containing protein [Planctomycetota bacterium]
MSQDQQTFARATTAALIGLATQLVITIIVAIMGVYTQSMALTAATWYLVGGLPIWVGIWVLYNQHRLERGESLEAQQLADSDARSAALFDEAGNQLAQSRRRLENLYKWGLPTISGALAVYLLGLGGYLLFNARNAIRSETILPRALGEDVNLSVVGLLLILCGMAGFLVSRYVAGMTRVNAWQGLRGGASYLIGNVFLAVAPVLIALGLDWFLGSREMLAYLGLVIPMLMVLLGLEIVLSFVMGVYRPRKADEFVRPAFDSRTLGLLTRPESLGKIFSETLNYQFGFEVSKSWFMQLLGRALLPLAVVCVLVILAMSTVVVVAPHQQAVITNNGSFSHIADPGIRFKAPWPIGRADKYNVNRVLSLEIGSKAHLDPMLDEDGNEIYLPVLWTNQHVQEGQTERFLATAPPPGAGTTGDTDSVLGEMVGADINVKFRIRDLRAYLGIDNPQRSAQSPELLLRLVAEQQVARFFATRDIDTLLTTGRQEAGDRLKASIQQELDTYNAGIEIVYVAVSGIHPPQEVAESFHERINSYQQAQTTVEEAKQEATVTLSSVAGSRLKALEIAEQISALNTLKARQNELKAAEEVDPQALAEVQEQIAEQQASIQLLLLSAGGEAGQLIAQARADRWSIALSARSRLTRREAEYQAYRLAPLYYPMHRYYETLAAAMADRPKRILGMRPGAEDPNVVFDLQGNMLPGISGGP